MSEPTQNQDYWSIVFRQLRKSKLGIAGLVVIFILATIAVFAPFLAESIPIVLKTENPVRNILDTEDMLPAGLNFPLLSAMEKIDYVLMLVHFSFLAGFIIYFLLRRRGGFRSTAFKSTAMILGIPFLLGFFLIIFVFVSQRARLDQVDFHEVQENLREGEWSLWPTIRYGPQHIDNKVESFLRPYWLNFGQRDRDQAKALAGKDWEEKVRSHVLGTDNLRRDILSRMIHGTRVSLSVGFVAVGIYLTIGIILGALAGFYGGWVDAVIMRLVEIVLCFPALFLIITVLAIVPPNIIWVMVVIGFVGWPTVARLVRGEFLRLRKMDFVSSALALGASRRRVIFRHILPNALAPVLVTATFGIAGAIMAESALSFLGIGVPVDAATWGNIMRVGRELLVGAPWVALIPGIAIFITIMSFNLFGESLRDALDPRLKGTQ